MLPYTGKSFIRDPHFIFICEQKDEFGLDICLKTYLGNCANPAEGHNHSEAHFQRLQHPIFMNLKLVPKAPPAEGEDQPA